MHWLDVERASVRLPAGTAFNANATWSERHSVLVTLGSDVGPVGYGEASPLPQYSPDDVDIAEMQLRALRVADLETAANSSHPAQVLEALAALVSGLCPSARFAVESAALSLTALSNGVTLEAWLRVLFACEQPASHEVAVDPSHVSCRHVDLRLPEPWRGVIPGAYKAKIGLELPVEFAALRTRPREVTSLRLDANGSLAGPELDVHLQNVAVGRPEFVEEPAPLHRLGPVRALPVPIAFDESLVGVLDDERSKRALSAWCQSGQVAAFVVKPMLVGGISGVVRLWNCAARFGIPVVFSHLHDGAVAASVYAALAKSIGSRRYAMGLFPHAGLGLWKSKLDDAQSPGS